MADTFEKFLQHVFSSPDLTSINEFNSEIQGFIATRMGLLSWSTEKQKQLQSQTLGMHASQHKRGARRGSEISNTSSGGTGGVSSGVGITGIGFGGLTSGICSGRNMFATRKDNIEMRFWVDEVDNYVALPSLLSLGSQGQKGNRNGPHGKDGANGDAQGSPTSHVGMDGKIANVLIAENGLVDGRSRSGSWSNGIFDAPIPHHAAHTIAQDPEFQNISRTQEPSGLLFREDKGPGDGPGRFKPPSVKTRERKQMGAGGPRRSLDQQSGVLPEPDEKSTLVPRPPHSGSLVQTVSYDYRTAGPEAVFSVAFTSALEDEFMAVGDLEEYLCYRSLNPAEPTPRLMKQEHDGPVRFVTVSNDLRLLATCGDDARLCVVDLVTKQCFLTLYHPGAVTCAAFSSNSQFVISGCADCRCRLWRTKPSTAPRELATYVGLHDRVTAIEFQSAGGLVAAGSKSGEVQMWVGSTLELVHTIGENILSSTIIGLSFNWNNEILLSADMKNILFSDVRTGAALKLLVPGDWLSPQKLRGMYENAEKPCFTAAAFAPKSLYPNYFLVGKGDCTIILYELHVEKKTDSGRSGGGSISAGNSIYANFSHGGGSSGMPQVEALEVKEVTEVWSEKLRAPPTCAFSGFSEKMILGDTNGNAIILHLESSTVIRKPPSLIGNPLRVCLPYPK